MFMDIVIIIIAAIIELLHYLFNSNVGVEPFHNNNHYFVKIL